MQIGGWGASLLWFRLANRGRLRLTRIQRLCAKITGVLQRICGEITGVLTCVATTKVLALLVKITGVLQRICGEIAGVLTCVASTKVLALLVLKFREARNCFLPII